jgi:hypothetical protein
MAAFPTNPLPDYPLEETAQEFDVQITRHRDGSEQRRKKGAGKRRVFKLGFGGSLPITQTEMQAILDHWTGQNGMTTSFAWAHPERGTNYTVRYDAVPTFTLVAYNFYTGSVVLQEVPA